ncbi:MAG: NUDIX hydrolase [Chthoniobacteraceae bacterium]|nr:NUDIX hydrolase [Chthoniobacteraceae bacterium]
MNRLELRALLAALDLPGEADEAPLRRRMLELLDSGQPCFERGDFPAHFTGSALVVSADGRRVLLHHHRKLDRWMQFGGHCEGDAGILAVAQREALEECGIEGLIPVRAVPIDLDIHPIPARPALGEPAHFHYDVRFLFAAPAGARYACSEESVALQWFTPEEALALPLGGGLLRLTHKWQKIGISPILPVW